MKVSAVLVTRGDVDMGPILASIPLDDVVVWDNSRRADEAVWGRYMAMLEAKHDACYTQDDDCLVDVAAVLREFRQRTITANVPPERRTFYRDGVTLLGWGSVFSRRLTDCFERYLKYWPMDDLFKRECDRIFTGLNRCRNIDVPFQHLPHAHDAARMGGADNQRQHLADLAEIRRRIYEIRLQAA